MRKGIGSISSQSACLRHVMAIKRKNSHLATLAFEIAFVDMFGKYTWTKALWKSLVIKLSDVTDMYALMKMLIVSMA